MSWIDVAILALVVLVGLLGLWKGVKKSAIALGAFLISFILAFFLANVIAEALLGIDSVKALVLGNGVGPKAQWSFAKMIYDGVGHSSLDEKSYLWANFYKPMMNVVTSSKATITAEGINAAQAGFALYGAFMMFSAICGVGIFIVVRVLLIIVTVVIKSFIGKKKTVLSRLFGFVVGAIRGALWMFAFTVVFSCFGGYTFVGGIGSIQKEYEENAVVCGTFNDWAYGLRNKLLLPDMDMYGRLVDMVYKKKTGDIPDAEKLAINELKLYVGISNLNYDGAPHGIDEHKKRTFDDSKPDIKLRKANEFAATGFRTVVQSILDYNTGIANKVDAKKTGLTQEKFGSLANIVTGEGMDNLDKLMDNLWAALRKYEYDFTHPEEGKEDSVINSTLSADYTAVENAIRALAVKFEAFEETFGAFPELTLPGQKHAGDAPTELPDEQGHAPDAQT